MSQKERILTMLEEAGSTGVTGNQFYAACLPRFAARLKELRNQGYDITTRRIDGNHFVYTLHPKEGVLNGEGRLASRAWPRKTGTEHECSSSNGAVTHSSVTGRDMEPGFSPPEGAPGRAQQDTEPVGRVLHALPTDPLPRGGGSATDRTTAGSCRTRRSTPAISGSYYEMEAQLDWEAA